MQISTFQAADSPPKTDYEKNLEVGLDRIFDEILTILNKGLLFSDNFDAYIGTLTTDATPGTETAIAHGLKRTPSGYLVISRDKNGVIYNGATAWDATNIYVRSNVASVTIKVIIF